MNARPERSLADVGETLLGRAPEFLLRAERAVRLLDRLSPLNLPSESRRLGALLRKQRRAEPEFRYAPRPELSGLLQALHELAAQLDSLGPLASLYAERARELLLEGRLALALGSPVFVDLAKERFPSATQGARTRLLQLLAEFRGERAEPSDQVLVRAGDPAHPLSLQRVLLAKSAELGLELRIVLRPGLASVAAAGDGFVALDPEARLSAEAAQRIALHELCGHVLPRRSARREALAIYRVGTRASNEDEEGRALLLEERAGFLGGERRRELALRHETAELVRDGAPFNDLIAHAQGGGLSTEAALTIALRARRGGGLGRELVYLPAFLRVKQAFSDEPALERYFERGRVSLVALSTLRDLELAHSAR